MKLICFALLTLAFGGPAVALTFDFESGAPAQATLDGAALTEDPLRVISGRASLLADFFNASGEWHEFFHTNSEVRFEAGKTYHVSFKYRIMEPGDRKTKFYSLLRSRSGGDMYGEYWLWNRERGATGEIHRLFQPENKDDWMLIIGVRNRGELVVDDITIREVAFSPLGKGLPVKNGPTKVLEIKKELDALRERQQTAQLMRQMQVIFCDEGSFDKARSRKDELVRDLNPDFQDWSPIGPLAKDYGVRSSTGGPEYQEFYKMEGQEVWDKRYELFVDNGFVMSLDQTLIQDETWGEGGYYTCHNGPGWHKWFTDELVKRTKNHLGVCQDNIGCATFNKGGGCFCKPCQTQFRDYLRARYTPEELKERGIADFDSFWFSTRVYDNALIGNRALEDPIVRDWIKFQNVSQLERWGEVVQALKANAGERVPLPVCGNQSGGFGMWPFAVAITQFNDIAEIEELVGIKDRIKRSTAFYKTPAAGGYHKIPVWVRGPVADDKASKTPMLSRVYWDVHFAEGYANGGVRDISFGMNAPWTGEPGTLDYIDSDALRQLWTVDSGFVDQNRGVLADRESAANVAVVYSLPSLIFRRYYPLGIDDNGPFQRFYDAMDDLEDWQIPFDVVVFGHPEFFATDLARLSRYRAIILPCADAISDIQAQALVSFAGNGGILVMHGDAGARDENFNGRQKSALAGVPHVPFAKGSEQVRQALQAIVPVKTTAPADVTVNLWLSCGGKSLDAHLVNYNADIRKETFREVPSCTVSVKLPSGLKVKTATIVRPSEAKAEAPVTVSGGWATVEIPPFKSYAIVSFADPDVLAAANAAASEARRRDKEAVKALAGRIEAY